MDGSRILVVEDDPLAARLLVERVTAMGLRATHAPTSVEAIDRALAERPDLILMDVGLGAGHDGIATAVAIRRALPGPPTPVVFLTMRTDTATVTRAELMERAAYLPKSCSHEELRLTLENALEADGDDDHWRAAAGGREGGERGDARGGRDGSAAR